MQRGPRRRRAVQIGEPHENLTEPRHLLIPTLRPRPWDHDALDPPKLPALLPHVLHDLAVLHVIPQLIHLEHLRQRDHRRSRGIALRRRRRRRSFASHVRRDRLRAWKRARHHGRRAHAHRLGPRPGVPLRALHREGLLPHLHPVQSLARGVRHGVVLVHEKPVPFTVTSLSIHHERERFRGPERFHQFLDLGLGEEVRKASDEQAVRQVILGEVSVGVGAGDAARGGGFVHADGVEVEAFFWLGRAEC